MTDGVTDEVTKNLDSLERFFSELPEKLVRFGIHAILAVLIFIIGGKLIRLLRKVVRKSLVKAKADAGVQGFMDSMLNVGLYALLIIWIASYFGVETTSLIALLGSAGVTIALALQGSLSNITGGVLLLALKPFKIGDYIIEDSKGNEGTVSEIGLFYTKLRTRDGRTVVLPNGTLANTSLTNVSDTPGRRLIMSFGISYDSSIAKAKELMLKLAEDDKRVLKDEGILVYVDELSDSQVTLGIRFYVRNEDYFAVKWAYTEAIKDSFDKNGIKIPYPQLDVHMPEEKKNSRNKGGSPRNNSGKEGAERSRA
ncbi:MAG: mechanosensitive ion channel family protein [Lachnospiraceae bacterium]|nr:mechanosensitive ion channel family protein [Lachnospiraceae bacterium]